MRKNSFTSWVPLTYLANTKYETVNNRRSRIEQKSEEEKATHCANDETFKKYFYWPVYIHHVLAKQRTTQKFL